MDRTHHPIAGSYVICTTARSGSNLLCDYLTNTEKMGSPKEYMNPAMAAQSPCSKRGDAVVSVSMGEYLAWARETTRSSNGVFGVKVLFEDYENLRRFSSFQDMLLTSSIFVLRRRSKIRQAISYFFAERTGQWIASDVPRMALDDVVFDFDRILVNLERLTRQESRWISDLDALGVSYSEIFYEDFVADPSAHVGRMAAAVGVSGEGLPIRASLPSQRTSKSDEFLVRFRSMYLERILKEGSDALYEGVQFVA